MAAQAFLPSLKVTNGQPATTETSYTHAVILADHLGRVHVVEEKHREWRGLCVLQTNLVSEHVMIGRSLH